MAGFTQAEVAKRLMQPLSFVAKYAAGARRIDVVELLQITDALRMDACAILRRMKKTRHAY